MTIVPFVEILPTVNGGSEGMKCPNKNPTSNDCRKCKLLSKCDDGQFLLELEGTIMPKMMKGEVKTK